MRAASFDGLGGLCAILAVIHMPTRHPGRAVRVKG
jgi:hypothetical protein